jgi:hypothetical protein
MPPNKSFERPGGGQNAKLICRRARRSAQPLAIMKKLATLLMLVISIGVHADEPEYTDLDSTWSVDLAAKRQFVTDLARRHYKCEFTREPGDFAILQKIVDDKLIPPENAVGYQALGVVFGDAIASEIDAEWKQVRDEYGINPVLKVRGKRAAIGALTIISKRIEAKGAVDIGALHENLVRDVNRLGAESQYD